MLAVLLIWAYSFMIFYIYGHGGLVFLIRSLNFKAGLGYHFQLSLF